MKRTVIILLALTMSFLILCACSSSDISDGNKESDGTSAQVSETQTTTASNTVVVTFPEGYTLVQIAEKLEESGVCSASEFVALTNNKEYVTSFGYTFLDPLFEKDRAFYLEGYIFPDTYEFYKNESAENVLSKILKNTAAKFTSEYEMRAAELGYTLDEIIALASIIQEEAYTNESMMLISSVLHNRIIDSAGQCGGFLQCDVTVFYVNDYITASPYLTGDTEKYKELYNTYKCKGVPQGPICCPGAEAVEAALYPAESNYYFFVTDKDWNYYFNETWEKHKAKCKELGL